MMRLMNDADADHCDDYDEWSKVGFAIHHLMGENGRKPFHDFSKQSKKYDEEECDKFYSSIKPMEAGKKPLGIGTLRHLAKKKNKIVFESISNRH